MNEMTWLLMQLSGIECAIEEVKERRYGPGETIVLLSDISEDKFNFILRKNVEIEERRERVDAKARALLVIASLLLGSISVATRLTPVGFIGVSAVLALVLLFVTTFLLTVYAGVNRTSTPDNHFLTSEDRLARTTLCNDFLVSQDFNDRATDFMVDLYQSALRYFSVAIFFVALYPIDRLL